MNSLWPHPDHEARRETAPAVPLTPFQRDIYHATLLHPGDPQYTVRGYDRFTGDGNEAALTAALVGTAARTDALRLRFAVSQGELCQFVDESFIPAVELIDLTQETNPEDAARLWLADALQVAYAMENGPFLDLAILKLPGTLIAHVRSHHAVCDAFGLQLFMNRVREAYMRCLADGNLHQAPDYPAFLDIAQAASNTPSPSDREASRAFFDRMTAGVEPALFARKRPPGDRPRDRHRFTLERGLIDRIRAEGQTPFLLLAAALAVDLARTHRTDEIILGIPVLGRTDRAAKTTVGQFATTLPLRVTVKPELSIDGFLGALKRDIRALLRHQTSPYGDLAAPSDKHFDTTLAYLRAPQPLEIPGEAPEPVAETHAHDTDALAIWASEVGTHSDLRIDMESGCDVFDADMPIAALAERIDRYVRAMAGGRVERIADLDPLPPSERTALIETRNATTAPFPGDTTLPHLFAEQVAKTPDATALIDSDGETVSFAALHAEAQTVAAQLLGLDLKPDDRIAVIAERGPQLLPAILGVHLAGAAYVPIDPATPPARIATLIEASGARAALIGEAAPGDLRLPAGCVRLRLRDFQNRDGAHSVPVHVAVRDRPAPDHLAYVIYTSGSTGEPKGVMVEHRSVVNRLWWMQRAYPITSADVLLQKTPISFDVSVWELFWWSFTGATLSVPEPGAEKDPQALLATIARDGVTVLHFVPSMLTPFLDCLESGADARHAARSLRLVFCSGEALSPAEARRFNRVFAGKARLVNLYGPTEATVDVSHYECKPGDLPRVPIGKPIDNIRLYVLGPDGQPQPMGLAGELHIGGVGVARGYLNQPALTADRFIDDPFGGEGKLYRTGDLARWLADGNLEYLGRADDQVKIRGNRVEPGEVSDHLARLPNVRDAIVIARTSKTRGTHLVGYYRADAPLDPADLRARLAERLPEPMIPAFFVKIDRVPLTANGKLDCKALPEPSMDETRTPPRTPIETELCAVWATVLGLESLGIHDDFHTLGGDSILMLRLRAEAARRGLHFALADLLRHPTVAGLARHVHRMAPANADVEAGLKPFALIADVDRPRLADLEDAFPVSRLSLGLFYHTIRTPESALYHDVFRYHFDLEWDEPAFRRALARLIADHPALRSSFDLAGCCEPVHRIHKMVACGLDIIDLTEEANPEALIAAHMDERLHHAYAIETPPLYRFAAFIRNGRLDLVFSFHHAILDGWSVAHLIKELMTAYRGAPPERALVPPLAAYVQAEQRALSSPETKRFWTDLIPRTEMTVIDGFGPHEPAGIKPRAAERIDLSADLVNGAREFAQGEAIPFKTVLLAAHCLTLHLMAGADTVITGTITHGRPDLDGADRMVGLFLNTLPVRSDLNGQSWREVVGAIAHQQNEAYPHRRYPLSAIQTDCGSTLQTAFNYVDPHVLETLTELKGLEVREETNFPLFVNAISDPAGGGLYLRIDGDGRDITASQAALLGEHFAAILARIIAHPDEQAAFDFLAAPGKAPSQPEPLVDVMTLFRRQAAAAPDRCALALGADRWTYAALDRAAGTVATRLRKAGAEPGDRIGVALDRSPEMIAVIFGILRAGLVCVPLDVAYPKARLDLIISASAPRFIVASDAHAHIAPATVVFHVKTLLADPFDIDLTAFDAPKIDDLALILFTSGSTGVPKGVELNHRMWANYTMWQLRQPSGKPGLSTLQFAPTSFDMAFQEMFSTLCGGGELRLVSTDERLDPAALLRLLDRYGVERVLLPYVALQSLAEASNALDVRPNALTIVVSSGEQLRITDDIRTFCAAMPGLLLENQYGPTETHQITAHSLSGDPSTYPILPPIGRPIDGVEIQLLDARMRPVPVGATGEIYAGGDCLARGYHGRADLTAERFVDHPIRNGARLYCTGDLGRRLADGTIVWLGRADGQVKVRGFRIEPAEVEIAIERIIQTDPDLYGIEAVAVVARRSDLCACLTGDPKRFDPVRLRQALRAELPDHMVPSHMLMVEIFPLTPSGKRDDAALRAIPLDDAPASDRAPPRDESEQRLATLVAECLGRAEVGIDDDFFTLGGTSLTAMRLVLTIGKRFGVDIPISALIAAPTVAGLADRLRDGSGVPARFDPLVPIRASGDKPPLFLVHPLGGHVLCYLALARALPDDQPVYALQAAGSEPGSAPVKTITAMAADYLAAIRTVQPNPPYRLSGWSFGGFVAYEMARQLEAENPGSVETLIVLDSITIKPDSVIDVAEDALLEFFYWELVWFERSHVDVETLPPVLTTLDAKLDHITAHAIRAGVLPSGTSRSTVERLFELFRANWRALIVYRPDPSDLDMALLRASGPLPPSLKPMHDAAGTQYGDPTNGWDAWTTGDLTVIDVPGDHLGLMDEPHVRALADAIAHRLSAPTQGEAKR